LLRLLRAAEIVDDEQRWAAGAARLWFVGDYADRGPDGVGVIESIMRLEREAAAAGGQVGGLLGNHDVLLMMAHRFGDEAVSGVTGLTFYGEWLQGGGQRGDLAGLTPERADWLAHRPAIKLVDDRLLVHSDTLAYMDYGLTIADVNRAVQGVVRRDDPVAWDQLLGALSTRYAFDDAHGGDVEYARLMLETFGGRQLIHGHTPIPTMDKRLPEDVEEALVYAEGLAVNVDGALYQGGPGFIHEPHSPGAELS
jgi:hypothetical protein